MSDCNLCHDEATLTCPDCNGSGEGMYDGTTCRTCKGGGAVPCECQEDRLRCEDDAREAAREDAFDARRDVD